MFENALLAAALRQMLILGLFVGVGFVAAKGKILPQNANQTLSKLETYVFIPALVMGKFISEFTVDTLSSAWKLLLFSLGVECVIILIAVPLARLISGKDDFLKNICTYGLAFSNFGFMGLPMIEAIFPNTVWSSASRLTASATVRTAPSGEVKCLLDLHRQAMQEPVT